MCGWFRCVFCLLVSLLAVSLQLPGATFSPPFFCRLCFHAESDAGVRFCLGASSKRAWRWTQPRRPAVHAPRCRQQARATAGRAVAMTSGESRVGGPTGKRVWQPSGDAQGQALTRGGRAPADAARLGWRWGGAVERPPVRGRQIGVPLHLRRPIRDSGARHIGSTLRRTPPLTGSPHRCPCELETPTRRWAANVCSWRRRQQPTHNSRSSEGVAEATAPVQATASTVMHTSVVRRSVVATPRPLYSGVALAGGHGAVRDASCRRSGAVPGQDGARAHVPTPATGSGWPHGAAAAAPVTPLTPSARHTCHRRTSATVRRWHETRKQA